LPAVLYPGSFRTPFGGQARPLNARDVPILFIACPENGQSVLLRAEKHRLLAILIAI